MIFWLTNLLKQHFNEWKSAMQKLIKTLRTIKSEHRPAFMMHMVAGYPDLVGSIQIAHKILSSGADILEVQIPFSDPVADGPIIAAANEKALQAGVTVDDSLSLVQELAAASETPILIMTYFNIVHHYGVDRFADRARDIGAQGLIIPDYPFDEETGNDLLQACKDRDLAFIQVMASTTRPARMQEIVKNASGFVYCMARTGTTGQKTVINEATGDYLKQVKRSCNLPLAVGFGISVRDQVEALKPYADIVVVGSALIRAYADKPLNEGIKAIHAFMYGLI